MCTITLQEPNTHVIKTHSTSRKRGLHHNITKKKKNKDTDEGGSRGMEGWMSYFLLGNLKNDKGEKVSYRNTITFHYVQGG